MINEDFNICQYIKERFEKAGLKPSYYEDGSPRVSWYIDIEYDEIDEDEIDEDEIDEGEYKVIITVCYDTPRTIQGKVQGEGSIEVFWTFSQDIEQKIEDKDEDEDEDEDQITGVIRVINFVRDCINGQASRQFRLYY